MQAIGSTTLAARQLQRLVDIQASAEVGAALHRAAPAGRILALADAVFRDANDLASLAQLRDLVIAPRSFAAWIGDLREIASLFPDSGACTIGTALELWSYTAQYFAASETQILDELTDVLVPLLAARALVLEVIADGDELRVDLAFVYAARAASNIGSTCAEVVFGYRRHLTWDAEGCAACYGAEQLDALEGVMPGIGSIVSDVIEADGSHPVKRGPCASFEGTDAFMLLRNKLDGCLTGARVAKDRAAAALVTSKARV